MFLAWCASGIGAACVPAAGSRRAAAEADASSPEGADAAAASTDTGVPASSEADSGAVSDAAGDRADVSGDRADVSGDHADAAVSDAEAFEDAGACERFVQLHDTHAQALYFDGTYGPLTGVCTVDYVVANVAVDLEFWHGHNGQQHHFVLLPEHFAALKRGERVMLETTEVDAHQHLLFIDPTDENYRVQGAPDVAVPIC